MLRERYDPINLFEYIPALGMETDAVLTQLDTRSTMMRCFKPSKPT